MNAQPAPAAARRIVWPSVVTVISAAILIGAEVFGAAFAGGWALAILFGLDDVGAHILQAVLFALGVFIMITFIRAAGKCRAEHLGADQDRSRDHGDDARPNNPAGCGGSGLGVHAVRFLL